MKTDETRMMDNSQETQFMPQDNTALNANDSTVIEENDQPQEGENKSASKTDSAAIRRRAIYGAAGFAGGGKADRHWYPRFPGARPSGRPPTRCRGNQRLYFSCL